MNSLREEINILVTSALMRQIDVKDSERDFYTNEIIAKIEKRIDEKINNINQEFKNEGYEGIDDIWMNLDVDDIVDYKELQSEKRALEEVKEMLK